MAQTQEDFPGERRPLLPHPADTGRCQACCEGHPFSLILGLRRGPPVAGWSGPRTSTSRPKSFSLCENGLKRPNGQVAWTDPEPGRIAPVSFPEKASYKSQISSNLRTTKLLEDTKISGFILTTHGNVDIGLAEVRDVAQPGSAPAWGVGGRRFKSARPDHFYL